MRTILVLLFLGMIAVNAQQKADVDLRGIKVYIAQKQLKIMGVLNMQKGLIELFATAPRGKEHESLLVLNCNPALLHSALLLIGLNSGGGGDEPGDSEKIFGDAVYIYVSWTDENNKPHQTRAEDLIYDKKNGGPMKNTPWIFTGSRFIENERNESVFAANKTSVLAATYYDPNAILNNPLPERTDDRAYYVNEKTAPKKGTLVEVTFSASPLEKSDSGE